MQFTLGLACLMMVACVYGAPQPGPPPVAEENLTPQCRTPKCPPSGETNLVYPMDCLLYVKCSQGEAKVEPCPADFHFNAAAGTCTDRASANCVNCWQKAPTR